MKSDSVSFLTLNVRSLTFLEQTLARKGGTLRWPSYKISTRNWPQYTIVVLPSNPRLAAHLEDSPTSRHGCWPLEPPIETRDLRSQTNSGGSRHRKMPVQNFIPPFLALQSQQVYDKVSTRCSFLRILALRLCYGRMAHL